MVGKPERTFHAEGTARAKAQHEDDLEARREGQSGCSSGSWGCGMRQEKQSMPDGIRQGRQDKEWLGEAVPEVEVRQSWI